jgi:hypothetical protein
MSNTIDPKSIDQVASFVEACAELQHSLSHPMGEGRGEGSSRIFTCLPDDFGLLTHPYLPHGREHCANSPLGPKSNSGVCCDPAVGLDTNSAANIPRNRTTWMFIASKPSLPSNSTGPDTDFPASKHAISSGTVSWPRTAFLSNACGTISSRNRKIGTLSWKISGGFCRNTPHIPATLHRYHTAANQINPKYPHPDPLPSDGRGEASARPLVVWKSRSSSNGFLKVLTKP